jgi:hypothetical protein
MKESIAIITNQIENQRKKLAKSNDLSKITFSILQIAHSLSPLERRWFSLFVCLAKLGFDGISLGIGELTDHEYRINGQTHSERSTYRALAGLESKKFITRSKFRIGPDKFKTMIGFEKEYFAWYLKKRFKDVTPIPTGTYTVTPLPSWQEDNLTSNSKELVSNIVPRSLESNKRAKSEKQNPKIASYLLPILITFRSILPGARRFSPADRARIFRRLENELESGDYLSGNDWGYWADRWRELRDVRDNIALTELAPPLLAPDYGRMNDDHSLDKLVNALANPPPAADWQVVPGRSELAYHRPPKLSLSREELELLEAARSRAVQAAGWS